MSLDDVNTFGIQIHVLLSISWLAVHGNQGARMSTVGQHKFNV